MTKQCCFACVATSVSCLLANSFSLFFSPAITVKIQIHPMTSKSIVSNHNRHNVWFFFYQVHAWLADSNILSDKNNTNVCYPENLS